MSQGPGGSDYLTTGEAAAYIGMSERYVRRLVASRLIAFHRVGRSVRIERVDLDRYMATTRVEPIDRSAIRRHIREVA